MTDPTVTTPTRRVIFVPSAVDAPRSRSGDLTVVLDTAWTPAPGDRSDVVSLRPYFAAVLERHDLFDEALVAVDRWAEATGLADALVVEGVTYWFRVRESIWHWVHERLLWRYALAAIDADGPSDAVSAPGTEEALIDVVRALGRPIDIGGGPPRDAVPAGHGAGGSSVTLRAALRRAVRRVRRGTEPSGAGGRDRREAFLEERFERLSKLAEPRVLVLTVPGTHQFVGGADAGGRRDPNLGPVIPSLREVGLEPILIGLGMNRRRHEEWAAIELDDRLLPAYFVRSRWSRPADDLRADAAVAAVLAGADHASGVPLPLDGLDMAPSLVAALRTTLGKIVHGDVLQLARVERLIDEVRPSAVLMSQESHRIPWLVAATRAGVPTFALQHGILYPTHPGYADRRHPSLVLPSCTFVYGEYEREVLEAGAYRTGEVVVSGSPRLDLDAAAATLPSPDVERATVRRELGVADGDRLLVVSTLHLPYLRRSHFVHMLEVVLGGPLPGVHVVFKQHPGEQDEGPYRRLLVGLARAGGYEPPPITVVKEIDLYRLLRAADAHLGQLSTVLTDAVVAGTCNLIAMVQRSGDVIGYVAAGVARPVHDIAELREALDDPRPPAHDLRQAFIDAHVRRGDASGLIAAAIRSAVREPTVGVVARGPA